MGAIVAVRMGMLVSGELALVAGAEVEVEVGLRIAVVSIILPHAVLRYT